MNRFALRTRQWLPTAARRKIMLTSAAPGTDAGLEGLVVNLNPKILAGNPEEKKMAIQRRFAFALPLALILGFLSLSVATPARAQEPKAQQNMIKEIRHQLVLL